MFLSKIWWFLVTLVGVVAAAVALVGYRPGQRELAEEEKSLILRSQATVGLLLRDNSSKWLALTGQGATDGQLIDSLDAASHPGADLGKIHATAQSRLQFFADQMKAGDDWIFLAVDAGGRVVARVGLRQSEYKDVVVGYPAVADALRGYRVEDSWDVDGKLYRVTAAPVIQRAAGRYVGALVIGLPVKRELAERLHQSADVDVAFFVRGQLVATSLQLPGLADVPAKVAGEREVIAEAGHGNVDEIGSDEARYDAIAAPLSGEARAHDAFFVVFSKHRAQAGLVALLKNGLTRADLEGFPWLPLGIGLLAALAIGMILLQMEGTSPLRRLVIEVQSLRKGGQTKLEDTRYRGRFGSLARAINTAFDRVGGSGPSEATGRRNLGEILGDLPPPGPAPGADSAFAPPAASPPAFPHPAAALRPAAPVGPPPLPPISSFAAAPPPPPPQAIGGAAGGAMPFDLLPPPPPPPPDLGMSLGALGLGAPPSPRFELDERPAAPQTGMVMGKSGAVVLPETALDDLVLPEPEEPATGEDDAGLRQIFEVYVQTKRQCGESLDGVTLEKFVDKLRQNKQQLLQKLACKDIRFEVYVKEGKASLKATPVK